MSTPLRRCERLIGVALSVLLLLLSNGAVAQNDNADAAGDLARKAQNPIADMISLPFQNNTNFKFGPLEKTQNVLNVQPVIPVNLNADWNLITRTIFPLVSQPRRLPVRIANPGWVTFSFPHFSRPQNRLPVGRPGESARSRNSIAPETNVSVRAFGGLGRPRLH